MSVIAGIIKSAILASASSAAMRPSANALPSARTFGGHAVLTARNWIGSALLSFFPLARVSVGVYLRVRLGRGVVRRCPMRPAFVMMRPGCVLRTRG